jgi:hypothetical protein
VQVLQLAAFDPSRGATLQTKAAQFRHEGEQWLKSSLSTGTVSNDMTYSVSRRTDEDSEA